MHLHNSVDITLSPLCPGDDLSPLQADAALGRSLPDADGQQVLVLRDGGWAVGLVAYDARPDGTGWNRLAALYLKPEYRGKRLGRWMLSAALRDMTSLGAEKVRLSLPADRGARPFFQQMGFSPDGEEPDGSARLVCFPGREPRLRERCCGAAIFARRDGQILWLTETTRKGHTALCKGHMEPGEDEHQTAHREIREETGLNVSFLGDFRQISRYSAFADRVKTVTFFLARTESTDAVPQPEEIRWVHFLPFDQALDSLTYADDRRILTAARDYLAAMDGRSADI